MASGSLKRLGGGRSVGNSPILTTDEGGVTLLEVVERDANSTVSCCC